MILSIVMIIVTTFDPFSCCLSFVRFVNFVSRLSVILVLLIIHSKFALSHWQR